MNKDNIEDLYQLSPTQHGMLFHTLYAPDSGIYIEQRSCALDGPLDLTAFEAAWQQIVDRHSILRTSLVWEDIKKPVQVVHKECRIRVSQEDWSHLSSSEQQYRLSEFLLEDRKRGFDLTEAPLMRLMIIKLGDDYHQFTWSNHHVIMDGWSRFLVLKEFFTLYEASRQGRSVESARTRPYRDYIAWHRAQDIAAAEGYWRETLKGFTAPTPLVVDRHTDGRDTDGELSGEQEVIVSASTTAALQALARQNQLTLSGLVQGAWALLLSRYSGEDDVVFGVTSSGRPAELKGAENMVGLFIVTLPARVKTPPDELLLPWLKQLQASQYQMLQFEYSPPVQVQRWSEIPPGQQLFQSIIVFENYPVENVSSDESGSFEIKNFKSSGNSNYPLALVVLPGPELSLRLVYNRQRFEEGTIRRMLGHLKNLLESIASDPNQRLATVRMLDDDERRQIVHEWNDTAMAYDSDSCIHEIFERQAERTPDAAALIYDEQVISYRELNRRANQLASYLRKQGVGAEKLVGIYLDRGIEMIVSLLGILKAGAGYVPLDPMYPKARQEMMVQDAGLEVVVAEEKLIGRLPEGINRVVSIDGEREEIARESGENIRDAATAENLAYVIYTSGSTGKPKGSLITHRGLCNVIQAQINAFDVRPGKQVLQFASLSFDTSVAQIFMAINSGATLFLLGQDPLYSQAGLIQFLRDNGITTADIGPTILGAFPAEEIPTLQTISTGGERCTKEVVSRWAPGRNFFNVYGLTETTICATIAQCSEDYPYAPPIGRPIGNTTVYLLNRNMEIMPVGVPGELFIGGVCLARGYMNYPDLTAERFIPDPFSNEAGARLFRTGDLGKYLPDGNIDFLGRADDQIKLRGLRIEPGEIETAIRSHPEIDSAVVLAKAVGKGSRRLIAYAVPNQGASVAPSDLRAFLKESLPEFMVPSAFVLLESWPLTVGRKIDRAALPDPDISRPDLDQNFEMPRSDVERTVASLWQTILEVEKVGLHDNFFDLGGHSLHMIQVHDKLRETYGDGLIMMDLFNHPTVSTLARRIVEGQAAAQPSPERSARATSRRESMRAQRQKRDKHKAEKESAKAQRN